MHNLTCIDSKKQGFTFEYNGKKCLKCSEKGVITLPYGPQTYCKKHFIQLTEKRVKRTIRKNKLIKAKEKLLIAVSGGKDSLLALYLINKFFHRSNEIHALMIDEGIKGYRDKAIKIAVEHAEAMNIPFTVLSFKDEFNYSMNEIFEIISKNKTLGSTCSFCGVLRRRIMNSFARKINADKLITGHNLDDETQSILMNVFDNNLEKFMRLGAMTGITRIKGFIPRIKPLIELPEKEIIAFMYLNELKFYDLECCPYSGDAKRNHFRSMLNSFEEEFPGTKHSILAFYLKLKENFKGMSVSSKINYCIDCGEITSGKKCNVCRKLDSLKK